MASQKKKPEDMANEKLEKIAREKGKGIVSCATPEGRELFYRFLGGEVKPKEKTLLEQIRDALEDDLNNYDDDYESWCEAVFDYPSGTLEELFKLIPEEEREKYDEEITKIIRELKS